MNEMIILAIPTAIILTIWIGYTIISAQVKKGLSYQKLMEINNNYKTKFIRINKTKTFHYNCNSLQQFRNRDNNEKIKAYLIEQLKGQIDNWLKIKENIMLNKENFAGYEKEVKVVYELSTYPNLKKKIETYILNRASLKPTLSMVIKVNLSYVSPKGKNSYKKVYHFTDDFIHTAQERLIEIENYKKTKTYQRQLMTPKLRFEILKRDGYKCKICGLSSNDGTELHVDHIHPIANGGKTEANNLQTLCKDCNLGKGIASM